MLLSEHFIEALLHVFRWCETAVQCGIPRNQNSKPTKQLFCISWKDNQNIEKNTCVGLSLLYRGVRFSQVADVFQSVWFYPRLPLTGSCLPMFEETLGLMRRTKRNSSSPQVSLGYSIQLSRGDRPRQQRLQLYWNHTHKLPECTSCSPLSFKTWTKTSWPVQQV